MVILLLNVFIKDMRVIIITVLCMLTFTACNNDNSRSRQYYYSDEGLTDDIPDTLDKVNLKDNKAIRNFLENSVFVAKNQKLVIDSSLYVVRYTNGKRESVMKCEISEYNVHNSRLLFFTDTTTQKKIQFTISDSGIITDMNTYSLYSRKK